MSRFLLPPRSALTSPVRFRPYFAQERRVRDITACTGRAFSTTVPVARYTVGWDVGLENDTFYKSHSTTSTHTHPNPSSHHPPHPSPRSRLHSWTFAFSSPATIVGLILVGASLIFGGGDAPGRPVHCDNDGRQEECQVEDFFIKEPITNTLIPKTLTFPSGRYTCIGAGVRQISFLKINVYVASLYVPRSFVPPSPNPTHLLHTPTPIILRIEPVRHTTGTHLRDGFVRILTAQMKDLPDGEREPAKSSLNTFRSNFLTGAIRPASALLFTCTPTAVTLTYENKEVFCVESSWLGKALVGCYVGDKVASENIRESVRIGVEKLVEGME